MSFNPKEHRDAWYVIRGFTYQVEITIQKWIELNDNQVLELERGEDIDTITNNYDNQEILRELGQVKHRESDITLNCESVLQNFLNYFDHINENPQIELFFRFITNAKYGQERPAVFADGTKGIQGWIELAEIETNVEEDPKFKILQQYILKSIDKKINHDASQKSDINLDEKNRWQVFFQHISDGPKFVQFIKNFGWSFNVEPMSEIAHSIERRLTELNLLPNQRGADEIHSRLFYRVFKILSEKGIKRLDRGLLLSEVTRIDFEKGEEDLLSFTRTVLNEFTQRVEYLEERVASNSKILERLQAQPQLNDSSKTIFEYQVSTLSTARPPLIASGSRRLEKVDDIFNQFEESTWINFHGISGCGKSQLAALVAERFNNDHWLDLRPFSDDPNKAIIVLNFFLSSVSKCEINLDRDSWFRAIAGSIKSGTLLIINDLPKSIGNKPFHILLASLANYLPEKGIKLLTTSNEKISSTVVNILSPKVNFLEKYDFDFGEAEITEYLENNGAPKHVLKGVNIITLISKGNPRFVSAIIYHLKSVGWGNNESESLSAILDEGISNEILNNEQESIKNLISDQSSKELLYRLSLIHWSFGYKEIMAAAEVVVGITHPKEKLGDLVNVWIQQLASSTFQISPLIRDIGLYNLSEEVRKNVYVNVAASLIADRKIDPLSGTRSISFFLKGSDFDNAGMVLLNIFKAIKNKESAKILDGWGLLKRWTNNEIPTEMSIVLRAHLRSEQIRIFRFLGEDATFAYTSIESMIEEPNLSVSNKTMLRFFLIGQYQEGDLDKYCEHMVQIFADWNEVETIYQEFVDLKLIGTTLWFPIKKIKNYVDVKLWINTIELVEERTSLKFFEEDSAEIGVNLIGGQILEKGNPKDQDSLVQVAEVLNFLLKYFQDRKYELLEAAIAKHKIELEYKGFKRKSETIAYAQSLIQKFQFDSSKYPVYSKVGKLLYQENNVAASVEWLKRAVGINVKDQSDILETHIYAAAAIATVDKEEALRICIQGERIVLEKNYYSELDIIQIRGELGIAYWLNKENNFALEVFEKLVEELINLKEVYFGQAWIRMFKWTGHTLGYIASDLLKDQPPSKTKDGGEYIPPYQGIYLSNSDLTDYYDPDMDAIICVHLAMIADGTNQIDKAYYWSLRAFDVARKTTSKTALVMVNNVCTPYMVVNFKVKEALESQLLAAVISHYFNGDLSKREAELSALDLDKLYRDKPSKIWSESEDTALTFGVVPLFILLLKKIIYSEEGTHDAQDEFFGALKEYSEIASDKATWEEMVLLTERIVNKTVGANELVSRANEYGKLEKNNLRIFSILGLIYLETPSEKTMTNLLFAIPYVFNIHQNTQSIVKAILVPFVKNRCIEIIKKVYIGSKVELNKANDEINEADMNNKYVLQEIFKRTIELIDFDVIPERKDWLYNNDTKLR